MVLSSEHINNTLLEKYIAEKTPAYASQQIRLHLNSCTACWNTWNHFRWNQAKDTQGYKELREYLGRDFKEYFDSSWALAERWHSLDPKTSDDIEGFYKENDLYIYNLLIWKESGQRPPYVNYSLPALKKYDARVICDFGCGIGNDGITLLEYGYSVIFCDFNNPSTEFLKWRLKKRRLNAPILEPATIIEKGLTFDVFWTMDTIEHLPHPSASLTPFLKMARLFIYDTEHSGNSSGRHPFHFPESLDKLDKICKDNNYVCDDLFQNIQIFYKTRLVRRQR